LFHSWQQAYRVVYISPRPDGGVVKGKAAEMAGRCAIEGECTAAR
jgi:hypothetical protein